MKNALLVFVLLILVSCNYSKETSRDTVKQYCVDSLFTICYDTVSVKMKGKISSSVLYNDKYYSFISSGSYGKKSRFGKTFYIISKNGDSIKEIEIPKLIKRSSYYQLNLDNDSIITKSYNKDKAFFLDTNNLKWIEIEKRKGPIFEDENYSVTSYCRGEFGGIVYFRNKHTNKVYEAGSTCTVVVNKIGKSYYILNYLHHGPGHSKVIEIENPENLVESKITFEEREIIRYTYPEEGVKVLLDIFDLKIQTSFVYKGKLFHIHSDDKGTYISKIQDSQLKIIYQFRDKIDFSFHQSHSLNTQFLNFSINDNIFGFVEIDSEKISFHYLMRQYEDIEQTLK